MTIIELINNWSPRAPHSRTFLIRYCDEVFDQLCDFMWGKVDNRDFYTYLESNTSLCIDHDYTIIRSNYFLSDKYIKSRVECYSFFRNDLFILYSNGEPDKT